MRGEGERGARAPTHPVSLPPSSSYHEFPHAGHMDFVMSLKDDVGAHVLKLLLARECGWHD